MKEFIISSETFYNNYICYFQRYCSVIETKEMEEICEHYME